MSGSLGPEDELGILNINRVYSLSQDLIAQSKFDIQFQFCGIRLI